MNENISSILKAVSKPGRYSGGEYGQIIKDKEKVKARFAFCFPDTYEIGMSNLGVRILYEALNRVPSVWCERVYAPWMDMDAKMKEYGIPLTAHESGDPLGAFDVVAFTLQYELCYTTALHMLKIAGIPLFSRDRGEDAPIILGGGPCAYNAEPVAVLMDKHPHTIATFFGVLYAGCFYAALDGDMPIQRMALILDTLKPRLLILR